MGRNVERLRRSGTMTPAASEIEIEATVDRVWSLLTEFRYWPAWGPSVRAVDSEAEAVALGVKGRVQTPFGLWLPFEIEDFESQRYWDWSVGGLRATGHRVTPLSDARSKVVFTAPRLFIPYKLVLARGLRRLKSIAESKKKNGADDPT
jgi:hypothetical protein